MHVNNSHNWINWINWIWGQHASEVKLIYFKLKAFSICFFQMSSIILSRLWILSYNFLESWHTLAESLTTASQKKAGRHGNFPSIQLSSETTEKKIDNHTQTSKWTTTNSVPVSVNLYLHYINIFLPIDPTSRISGDKCSFRFKELIKCVK